MTKSTAQGYGLPVQGAEGAWLGSGTVWVAVLCDIGDCFVALCTWWLISVDRRNVWAYVNVFMPSPRIYDSSASQYVRGKKIVRWISDISEPNGGNSTKLTLIVNIRWKPKWVDFEGQGLQGVSVKVRCDKLGFGSTLSPWSITDFSDSCILWMIHYI